MDRDALQQLSKHELITLVQAQADALALRRTGRDADGAYLRVGGQARASPQDARQIVCFADPPSACNFLGFAERSLLQAPPVLTRVHRHCGACPCCRRAFSALVPEGLAPGSPFGPEIVALVMHLHVTQAIGFDRLSRLMSEVFGLIISEGAISNFLARAEAPLTRAADAIANTVWSSKVIASAETSARVPVTP